MIPKTIHYCWFGGNEKPKLAVKCINSWRNYCNDYQIIEWNEKNFDVYQNAYTTYLYENHKYAFLSDFARLKIIYENGGIYFDTDVEVIRPFDSLLYLNAYFGFETNDYINTGLGFGAEKGHPLILDMMKEYDELLDGEHGYKGCPILNTEALVRNGLVKNGKTQIFRDFTVFSSDYFNPYDDPTGILNKTDNTLSIHWYAKSWMSKSKVARSVLSKPYHRVKKYVLEDNLLNKPYFKACCNIARLNVKKLIGKNIIFNGIPLLGYNTRITMNTNSKLILGDRVISDGRFVIVIDDNAVVSIGERCYFNEDCMISSKSSITIGPGCQLGPGVKIFDNNHRFDAQHGVKAEHTSAPITIGENSWIGSNCTILKGVTIGKNCVIGAGCVISRSIPDESIVKHTDDLIISKIENR